MAGFCQPTGAHLDIDRLLALSELAAMPIGEWGEQLAADAGEGLTLASPTMRPSILLPR